MRLLILVLALCACIVCLLVLVALVVMIRITAIRGQSSSDMRCPVCGVRDVRLSTQCSLADRVYMRFGCVPYRCRYCGARFRRYEERQKAAV